VLKGVSPGSLAELDLRAARARRHSESRRRRALDRLRSRRRAGRVLVVAVAAAAVALAAVAGPRGASTIRHRLSPAAAARCPVPSELRPAFVAAARATGVQLGLLAAVAAVESRFDPGARSHAGAVGVLQLMPATAASLHYDAQETRANVMAGALYLQQMLGRFDSTELALAAYNAGPTAVDRLGAAPTAETAAYVDRVEQTRRGYGDCS
jgi:peptidoglycan DL-endopeptidase CwlO